jgi:hypothetical protein
LGGFRPGQYRKRTVYTPVERAKLGELREDLAGLLTDEAPAGGAATGETPELWRRHRR